MTKKLIDICEKVLVVQEGGYNVELIGQHASGVVNALAHGKGTWNSFKPEPTETDIEMGYSCIEDIKKENCKEWAK